MIGSIAGDCSGLKTIRHHTWAELAITDIAARGTFNDYGP